MIKELMKHRNKSFPIDSNLVSDQHSLSNSEGYNKFLLSVNGGYFYSSSLHLFGIDSNSGYHDIFLINDFVESLYKELVEGLFIFGEDLFGNLFAIQDNDFIFFNIETGERKILAAGFEQWCEVLQQKLSYLTGQNLVNVAMIEKLSEGYRYCPKMPFILGGDYYQDNLILKKADENLKFCSSIAHQIYGLPDGTKFQIKFK